MNQFVLFNFSITKNDRMYRLVAQPGSPWQEIEEVLEEFKKEFAILKLEAKSKQEEFEKNKTERESEVTPEFIGV